MENNKKIKNLKKRFKLNEWYSFEEFREFIPEYTKEQAKKRLSNLKNIGGEYVHVEFDGSIKESKELMFRLVTIPDGKLRVYEPKTYNKTGESGKIRELQIAVKPLIKELEIQSQKNGATVSTAHIAYVTSKIKNLFKELD